MPVVLIFGVDNIHFINTAFHRVINSFVNSIVII